MGEAAQQTTEVYGSFPEPAYGSHLALVDSDTHLSDQDNDPASDPEEDKNWDEALTNYIGAHANDLIRCTWLGGAEVLLSTAMLAYPLPITPENVSMVLADAMAQERVFIERELEEFLQDKEKPATKEKVGPKRLSKAKEEPRPILLKADSKQESPRAEVIQPQVIRPPQVRPELREEAGVIPPPIKPITKPQSPNSRPVLEEYPGSETPTPTGRVVPVQRLEAITNKLAYEDAEVALTRVVPLKQEVVEVDVLVKAAASERNEAVNTLKLAEQPIYFADPKPEILDPENTGVVEDEADIASGQGVAEISLVTTDQEIFVQPLDGEPAFELAEDEVIILRRDNAPAETLEPTEKDEPALVPARANGILTESLPADTELPVEIVAVLDAIAQKPVLAQAEEARVLAEPSVEDELGSVLANFLERLPLEKEPQIIESLITYTNSNYTEQQIEEIKKELATVASKDGTHESIKKFLVCINTIQKSYAHAGSIGKSAIVLYNSDAVRQKFALSFNFG